MHPQRQPFNDPNAQKVQAVTMGDPTADAKPPSVSLAASGGDSPIGESPTVSSLLNSVIISEAAAEDIWRLLAMALSNESAYRRLLELKDEEAQIMLDILQKALASKDIPVKLGHAVQYAMMRLCTASDVYPRCLALRDVRYETTLVASGGFSEIWKGNYKDDSVCLKVVRVDKILGADRRNKIYMREAILWSHLSHPNLLPFYGIYHVDDHLGRICLVSPWMQNGNVNEYLKIHPEAPRLPLVHDILEGLRYLHKQNVVHGDLKGANILISDAGSACLADFGSSSIVDSEILRWTSLQTLTRVGGTIRWQAPELMDDRDDGASSSPTFAADVYAFASVMYEVFMGQLPFYDVPRDITIMIRTIKGVRPTRPSLGQALELSAEIWQVMESCWSHDPTERPSVDQIAESLSRVRPTESAIRRIKMQKIQQKQGGGVAAPTPLSFRAAMYGGDTHFSQAEINLLQEYAGDSLQSAFDSNFYPLGFTDSDVNTHDVPATAVAQRNMRSDLETNSISLGAPAEIDTSNTLTESQAVLEAVLPGRDTSVESSEANEALANRGHTSSLGISTTNFIKESSTPSHLEYPACPSPS